MKIHSIQLLCIFLIVYFGISVIACKDTITKQESSITENQILSQSAKSVLAANNKTESIDNQFMVIFKERWYGNRTLQAEIEIRAFTDQFLKDHQIPSDSILSRYEYALRGIAVQMNSDRAQALKEDPRVEYIEQNRRFRMLSSARNNNKTETTTPPTLFSQTIPWGVQRVGGPFDGTSKKAWILDTGIDLDHPDLNVDTNNSVSFITGESADDLNGHGTHLAGILAAKNNSTGVVGVAAGASVVSVKIADQDGTWNSESFCDGMEHVMEYASTNDVVNLSVGVHDPGSQVLVLDTCVENAADMGFRIVIAAGNAAVPADEYTPARVVHQNVWTVSAFRQGDEFVEVFDENTPNCDNPFQVLGSNYGNPPVDFASPGENIFSLWRNGGTNTTCGTSQAAPHVAGLLLACGDAGLETDGTVSNDPASPADPIAWGFTPSFVSNVTHSVVPSQVTPGYYSPKLDWNSLSGAIEYEIQRKHWQWDWKIWAITTSTTYTDIMTNSQSLQAFQWGQPMDYWVAYRVRAVAECGAGPWSQIKYFKYHSGDSIPLMVEMSE
jgi:hypothetical protein